MISLCGCASWIALGPIRTSQTEDRSAPGRQYELLSECRAESHRRMKLTHTHHSPQSNKTNNQTPVTPPAVRFRSPVGVALRVQTPNDAQHETNQKKTARGVTSKAFGLCSLSMCVCVRVRVRVYSSIAAAPSSYLRFALLDRCCIRANLFTSKTASASAIFYRCQYRI